jgi:hypothetical protein
MPKQDPSAARRLLVAQVRDLATGVGLAIRTARALHLPVEPRRGRGPRQAHPLGAPAGGRGAVVGDPMPTAPSHPAGPLS